MSFLYHPYSYVKKKFEQALLDNMGAMDTVVISSVAENLVSVNIHNHNLLAR